MEQNRDRYLHSREEIRHCGEDSNRLNAEIETRPKTLPMILQRRQWRLDLTDKCSRDPLEISILLLLSTPEIGAQCGSSGARFNNKSAFDKEFIRSTIISALYFHFSFDFTYTITFL